jgi:hypothetical protein
MPDATNHHQGFSVLPDSVLEELAELKDRVTRLETAYRKVYELLTNISKIYDKPPAGEVKP